MCRFYTFLHCPVLFGTVPHTVTERLKPAHLSTFSSKLAIFLIIDRMDLRHPSE